MNLRFVQGPILFWYGSCTKERLSCAMLRPKGAGYWSCQLRLWRANHLRRLVAGCPQELVDLLLAARPCKLRPER